MQKYYVNVYTDGTTRWYKDAKCTVLHRLNGPAIEYADGSKMWYVDGKLHRTDGPAIEWCDGSKWWYIDSEKLTEAEHRLRTQPAVEMTVAEIEAALGKRVKIIK